MSTILDFLIEGRLADIAGGDSEADVRERLGDPDDIAVQSNPTIWKYGPIQLAFLRGRSDPGSTLKSIYIAFDTGEPLPERVRVEGWWPNSDTTPQAFRAGLEGSPIRVVREIESPPNRYLVLSTGDRATFVGDRLHSLNWSSRSEAPAKQVTVTISSSDLEAIRKIASESKLSLSALCSKWISEHVGELCKAGST